LFTVTYHLQSDDCVLKLRTSFENLSVNTVSMCCCRLWKCLCSSVWC